MGDLWFETSTLGLSEKIFDELAGQKFEGNLTGLMGKNTVMDFLTKA